INPNATSPTLGLAKTKDVAMNIRHASNLLNSGEGAIVLFTKEPPNRGDNKFLIRSDGSGWSGNWMRVSSYGQADKVIIYYRPPNRDPRYGEIFLADYVNMVMSPEPPRLRINFQGIEQVGTTNQTWLDFAG